MHSSSSSSNQEHLDDLEESLDLGETIPVQRHPLTMMLDDESDEQTSDTDVIGITEQPTNKIRKRCWFGTVWKEYDWKAWYEANAGDISRLAVCKDIAPTTGRVHWHIAVIFNQVKSLKYLTDRWSRESKWRWFNTNNRQAVRNIFNYVLGKGKNQHKNELKEVIICEGVEGYTVRAGKRQEFYDDWWKQPTMDHAIDLMKTDKYRTMIGELKHIKYFLAQSGPRKHTRQLKRMVIWLWGGTGTGKTFWAKHFMDNYEELTGKPATDIDLSPSGQVTQLHGDEGCVVMDDIKLAVVDIQRLLILMDTYPTNIDIKGGNANYDPDVVIVTCTVHPASIGDKWQRWKDDYQQVARRVTHIIQAVRVGDNLTYTLNEKNYTYDQMMKTALDFVAETFGQKLN